MTFTFKVMMACFAQLAAAVKPGYKLPLSGPQAITEANADDVLTNIVRTLTSHDGKNPMKSDGTPPVLSDVEMAADLRSHQRAAFGTALRKVEREIKRAATGGEMTDAEVNAAIDQLARCG